MTVQELRKQRGKLVREMNDLLSNYTPENREKWARMDKDQESLRVRIEALENGVADPGELRSADQPLTGLESFEEYRIRTNPQEQRRASKEYRAEFLTYARTGVAGKLLTELRYNPMDETTTTGGEYLMPIGFQKELEIKLKAYGGMRRNCRIVTTATGNLLNWPTMNDVTNSGQWLAINTPVPQQNPSFGQVQFTANLVTSQQVLIPVQLLQDSAIDLQDILTDAFAVRIGRTVNNGYTLGNGSGQPNGIVPQVVAYGSGIVTAQGDTQSGNTYANSIGVNDLANMIANLDPAYRPGAKWMGNQATFDTMRKLKDSLGRPLWEASLTAGVPDRIFGYPWDWNQDFATIAAGAYSLLFGQMDRYVIRDVLGFTFVRFNETYMASHQVGFQAYLRTDGQLLQPAAFAILYHPLS